MGDRVVRQRFEAEVPEGMRLGSARSHDGGFRGMLFDEETNKLVTHANFYEVEDDEDDEDDDEFVKAISGALALLVISSAAPHVRRWWQRKAVPALRSTQLKVRSTWKRTARTSTTDLVTARQPEPSDLFSDDRLQATGLTMTSEEAWRRFTEAVLAMAFARSQMSVLQNASISDDDGPSELARALQELSPERVEDAIHALLEADPSMLDRQNLAAFKLRREAQLDSGA